MPPRETIGHLAARLSTRFKRRFSKDVHLADARLRALHDRLEAVAPAALLRQRLKHSRFVVIDTETTGLKAYGGDEIVSIAMLELIGLELTGMEYVTLIDPGRPIPPDSTAVHGLGDDDVVGSPRLTEVLGEVVEFIGQGIMVGHHVDFDLRFLNRVLQKELLSRLHHPHLDTMLLYTAYSGRVGHYTLDEVAGCCALEVTDRHTARGDALATARLFQHLAKRLANDTDRIVDLAGVQHELGHFAAPI